MPTVTLYTRPGCHLCDDVKADLAALRAAFPHALEEVDITTDDALYRQHRYAIPVVQIGDATLSAPITVDQLRAALARLR